MRSDNGCSRHGFHVADCNFAGLKHHNCSGPFQRCLLVPNPQRDLLYAHVHMYPVFFMTSHANAALIPFGGLQAMMLLQVDPRPAQMMPHTTTVNALPYQSLYPSSLPDILFTTGT